TDGVEHQAVLLAQDLFLLLVGEAGALRLLPVGSGTLANAPSADEDLGLEKQIGFAGLALHVIDRVFVLNVGIEAKDHGRESVVAFELVSSKMAAGAMITDVRSGSIFTVNLT